MVFHSVADTTVGTAQGTRIAARSTPRPRNFLFSISARASATTMSKITVTTVKASVRSSAAIQSGDVNMVL